MNSSSIMTGKVANCAEHAGARSAHSVAVAGARGAHCNPLSCIFDALINRDVPEYPTAAKLSIKVDIRAGSDASSKAVPRGLRCLAAIELKKDAKLCGDTIHDEYGQKSLREAIKVTKTGAGSGCRPRRGAIPSPSRVPSHDILGMLSFAVATMSQ